ncbi:C-C motif chemokine 20-like [Rhinoderma darwinii]|uniref:C-C motif chemokine 20-like n=1 Tax=Rhinoderma darwinii TaxID=43563 RepID=UPI003F66C066
MSGRFWGTLKPLKHSMSLVSSLSVLYILLLGFPPLTNAVFDCCYTYTRKPLPQRAIKGYIIQSSAEVCDIDAIIIITKKFRVCANPKDKWVMRIITKLKKKEAKHEQSLKNLTQVTGN